MGVSFGVGKGSAGFSVDVSASRGQGQQHGGTINPDGSKDYTTKPENQYIIFAPQSNNVISENIIAAVQKSGLTPYVGLTNAEEQTANVLQQITQQGGSVVVDSHSRGTLTTTNAEQYLVNQGGIKDENGNLIQPSIQMNNYGGAQNVQTGNQTLQQLTGNNNAKINSVVQQNDFIGTVVGGNPATSSYTSSGPDGNATEVTSLPDGRSAIGNVYNVLKGTATPHNCYGTSGGTPGCDKQWENLPISSAPKISSNPTYKSPVVIPDYQSMNTVEPQFLQYGKIQLNQMVPPSANSISPVTSSTPANRRLQTLQNFKQEE